MKFEFKKVELSKINWADASFCITEGDAPVRLIKSIDALGLLSPPSLFPQLDRFVIVSGFARLKACRQLNLGHIFARIIDSETPRQGCVQLAIAEKAYQRELNTLEMARVAEMLYGVCRDADEVLDVAQNLGLSVNLKMLDKLIAINQMPDSIKKGLRTGAIALPVAIALSRIEEKRELDAFCQLFIQLNLSLNRQRSLFEWVVGISKREQISIADLLTEQPFQALFQNPDVDVRQRAVQIRNYLKRRRYPSISCYEERYIRLNKKLELKKGMKLTAPSNFEGGAYSLQIDFKDKDQMKEMAKEVDRVLRSPHMVKLLKHFKI